jgi:hypothetical protein
VPAFFGFYMQTRGYFAQVFADALFIFVPLFLIHVWERPPIVLVGRRASNSGTDPFLLRTDLRQKSPPGSNREMPQEPKSNGYAPPRGRTGLPRAEHSSNRKNNPLAGPKPSAGVTRDQGP